MGEPKNIDTKGNIFYFFIFTLAYSIIKQVTKSKGVIWLIIYLLLVLFSQYYINLNLSKGLCGQEQHSDVFFNTLLPWLLILCTTVGLLEIFPGWLRPFSNTLGYSAAKFAGIDELVKKIFKKGEENTNTDKLVVENLEHIYNNPAQMINDIDLNETESVNGKDEWKFWHGMKRAHLFIQFDDTKQDPNKDEELLKDKLKGMIHLKDNVAYFFWYMLSGILAIIVSENFILGATCSKSLEELEAEYDDYLDEKNKKASEKPTKAGGKTGAETT